MTNLDFVSIDFETLTPELTSACAVGLVKVRNGIVVQKFYSLIKPIPDGRLERNTFVHNISDEMLVDAPTFEELFPVLKRMIGGDVIVCHNRSTDINIIERCMSYYQLSGIDCSGNVCTYELYGKGLMECCKMNGIVFDNHHDALADAEACAKIYLCYNGRINADLARYDLKEILRNKEARTYQHDTLKPLSSDEIEVKDTVFFRRKVVITGVLDAYPDRDRLGETLKSFGADVDTAISGKTNIVIVGHGAGPSKLKKVQEMRDKGKDVQLIYEEELCSIMTEIIKL